MISQDRQLADFLSKWGTGDAVRRCATALRCAETVHLTTLRALPPGLRRANARAARTDHDVNWGRSKSPRARGWRRAHRRFECCV